MAREPRRDEVDASTVVDDIRCRSNLNNTQKNRDYRELPADRIFPSPFNEGVDMDRVEEYAKSMRENGILEPIVVYDKGDEGYEIQTGHQRYEAWCHVLKHDTIRAIVKPYEPNERKRFIAHTEANTLKRNLDLKFWLSRIKMAKRVLKDSGFSGSRMEEIQQLSLLLNGISQSQLYRYEHFERLIPELQDFESRKWLSSNTLYYAASLDEEQQRMVAAKVMGMYGASGCDEKQIDFEITREQFKKIVADVKNLNATKERKRRNFEQRTSAAAGSFLKHLSAAQTAEDKAAALQTIAETRAALDKLEAELSR